MSPVLVLISGVSASSFAAATAQATDPATPILWTAGLILALGVIYKFLHIGEIIRETRKVLKQWNGEPAAPGIPARMSLPAMVEYQGHQLHEIKGRDAQLVVALEELNTSVVEGNRKADLLEHRIIGLDERVTEHRRRNDETAVRLAAEVNRRATELELKVTARDQSVDSHLGRISDDLQNVEAMRATNETMRAALTELGIDIDLPTSERT